ncbi:MAG: TatD family hydrolase [Candidatus Buchananbacteria bacterium]
MLFDSHAHLNFKAFEDDLAQVIKRCVDKKMIVVNVGSQLATSKKTIEIANTNSGFFSSVGIHPIHVSDPIEADKHNGANIEISEMFLEISRLAKNFKVVAIGETGLDYLRLGSEMEKVKKIQKEYFLKHIELANSLNKPLIIHSRASENSNDAYLDILDILKTKEILPLLEKKGVMHCYISGSVEIAKEFIKLGFAVGITGIVTFKKKSELIQEVVREVPLENILIETDSPYLTPEPFRGQRNEPIFVEQVAKKIAELKGLSLKDVIAQTTKNAKQIFKII